MFISSGNIFYKYIFVHCIHFPYIRNTCILLINLTSRASLDTIISNNPTLDANKQLLLMQDITFKHYIKED